MCLCTGSYVCTASQQPTEHSWADFWMFGLLNHNLLILFNFIFPALTIKFLMLTFWSAPSNLHLMTNSNKIMTLYPYIMVLMLTIRQMFLLHKCDVCMNGTKKNNFTQSFIESFMNSLKKSFSVILKSSVDEHTFHLTDFHRKLITVFFPRSQPQRIRQTAVCLTDLISVGSIKVFVWLYLSDQPIVWVSNSPECILPSVNQLSEHRIILWIWYNCSSQMTWKNSQDLEETLRNYLLPQEIWVKGIYGFKTYFVVQTSGWQTCLVKVPH